MQAVSIVRDLVSSALQQRCQPTHVSRQDPASARSPSLTDESTLIPGRCHAPCIRRSHDSLHEGCVPDAPVLVGWHQQAFDLEFRALPAFLSRPLLGPVQVADLPGRVFH